MTLSPQRTGTDVGYECFTHFYPHDGLRALAGGQFPGSRLKTRVVTGWSAASRGLFIVMLISLCLLPVAVRAQDGMPTANPEMPAANDEAVPNQATTTSAGEEAAPPADAVVPAQDQSNATTETAPVNEETDEEKKEVKAEAQNTAAPAKDETPVVAEEAAPAKEDVAPASVDAVPTTKAEAVAENPAAPASEGAAPVAETIVPMATEAAPAVTGSRMLSPVAAAPVEKPVDPGVPVDHFEFSYGLQHPALPPLDELKDLSIKTTQDGNVYRAPAAGGAENVLLSGIPQDSQFDGDALREVAQEVVRWYNSRGLYGVWVAYTDLESSVAGVVDNRAADNKAAHLVIWASQVDQVRTLARGKRIKSKDSINHPKHRRIIKYSPLRPAVKEGPGVKAQPGSLFSQEVLDDYLYGLSLHPGRRVEASIASAGEPGLVVLDYLVNEARTWQIFSQFNNYGSESTGRNRVRLGFQHNQLSNHDDTLNVDLLSTTDFKTYGSFVAYRIPVWRPAKLHLRVYGSYGDFIAAEGDAAINLRYVGRNWMGGMELANRLTLWRDWQLVSVLGANFNHYGIQQKIGERANPLVDASSNFLVPFIGTTLSRSFSWGGVSGGVRFDHTLEGYANDDNTHGYKALGRSNVDADWTFARWNLNGTVYLDQLFRRSRVGPLAHELSLRTKGRVLLRGEYGRLIPHEQEPLGGALSVRGYSESVLSADEFYAGTIEYAFHIPRILKSGDEGKLWRWPFKWRPKQTGQNPDWDLVLRGFYDYAYRGVNPPPNTANLDPVEFEKDLTYIDKSIAISGMGVGISLTLKQNFSVRCDYGVAQVALLDDQDEDKIVTLVPKGNKEIYFVGSFSW